MEAALKLLLIHQNFPGQFPHLARHLAATPGVELVAICREGAPGLAGIRTLRYALPRQGERRTHQYVRPLEQGVLHGQAVVRVLQELERTGFVPDVVIAHPGWGEALFIKDIFPRVKVIGLFEFFYHGRGADTGFDPAFPVTLNQRARIRSKNALHLLNLEYCDAGVSPTLWQKSVHPQAYQQKIAVIHEGVDTDLLVPDRSAEFTLPNGKTLRAGDEVLTYVSRNLEPYRGFPTMMRAVAALCRQRPGCDIILVGGDDVSYGVPPADAPNWRSKLLAEVSIDPLRVHFLGRIPYDRYRKLLQVSAAHVYLTYPFVLSWSMLEAMASECVVIGSATAPVKEVIEDGKNGILVDFFDVDDVVRKVADALDKRNKLGALRAEARRTIVERYNIEEGVRGYMRLIDQLLQR